MRRKDNLIATIAYDGDQCVFYHTHKKIFIRGKMNNK
jgi:hypothetical protein